MEEETKKDLQNNFFRLEKDGCPLLQSLDHSRLNSNHNISSKETLSDICDFVFQNLETEYKIGAWLCSRAILCPTNEAVDEINDHLIHQFPGEEKVYRSSDKLIEQEEAHKYPEEFLNSITASGMPPHRLGH